MICFHVTPITPRTTCVEFLKDRYALISIVDSRDIEIAKKQCKGYIIDNGAYSTWKKKKKLDFDGYIEFCESHMTKKMLWVFIPDVIDGTESDNDALLNDWPKSIRSVPIYHLHESLSRLERLTYTYGMVALGSSGKYSMPGSPSWWNRIQRCMDILTDKDGFPVTKIHGLRMMSSRLTSRIPFYSVDSSNVARNSYNMSKRFPGLGETKVAILMGDRIERLKKADRWIRKTTFF